MRVEDAHGHVGQDAQGQRGSTFLAPTVQCGILSFASCESISPVKIPNVKQDLRHPSIAIARTARRTIVILLNHVSTGLHTKLSLLQYTPQLRIAWVCKLDRLQLRLVPYPGIAAGIEQYLYDGVAVGPLSLVERVHVADGLVKGSVLFQAVDLFDLYALLVEQDVEDIIYASD
tara:strand:- start:3283 stop:3804 length:522 start_codon:yes stop_codon:yes gene_type:complete